jgi:hypothetical protein
MTDKLQQRTYKIIRCVERLKMNETKPHLTTTTIRNVRFGQLKVETSSSLPSITIFAVSPLIYSSVFNPLDRIVTDTNKITMRINFKKERTIKSNS